MNQVDVCQFTVTSRGVRTRHVEAGGQSFDYVQSIEDSVAEWWVSHASAGGSVPVAFAPGGGLPRHVLSGYQDLHEVELVEFQGGQFLGRPPVSVDYSVSDSRSASSPR